MTLIVEQRNEKRNIVPDTPNKGRHLIWIQKTPGAKMNARLYLVVELSTNGVSKKKGGYDFHTGRMISVQKRNVKNSTPNEMIKGKR